MKTETILSILFILSAQVLQGATWQSTQWNSGVKVQSTATGFTFVFPGKGGHVNSIQRSDIRGQMSVGKTVTFTCRVKTLTGNPKFVSLDPAPAPPALMPNCRVLIQRKGDDWTCSNATQNYRWWSTGALCAFLKADGQTYSYNVKLIPANWSNCWGKIATQNKSEFKAALANADNVQIVFGGGNSFSHGVAVKNGKARFELLDFKIK